MNTTTVVELAKKVRTEGGYLKVNTEQGFYLLRPTEGEEALWTWQWHPGNRALPTSMGWSIVRNKGLLMEIDGQVVRTTAVEIVHYSSMQ